MATRTVVVTEPEEIWINIGDAAKLFAADPKTVTRWEQAGILRGNGVRSRRTPGGHRKFLKSTITAYLDRLENGK